MKTRRKYKATPQPPSMVNPPTDLLVRRTRSRYVLVMLASKRARQLLKGAECKVANHENKYVTNAFEEIAQKKIKARLTIANEQQAIDGTPLKNAKVLREPEPEPKPRPAYLDDDNFDFNAEDEDERYLNPEVVE